ncbi:hypothetical protein [Verrucosispora sp. TAA-831]|uniref:hypothetical protein n=1 Tax=Verrucosispora sp. TAA-831 TaxID=3422227 RepID=UPI003D6FD863
MRIDPSRFVPGDEWAYRARDNAPSERVQILVATPTKTGARVEVRFLDDLDGRTEDVPGSRLRVPWSDVASLDAMMANWQRINDLELDDTEQACVEEVFQLLIPNEVAEIEWSPVTCATRVRDMDRLSDLIRIPMDEILAAAEWFELDDAWATQSSPPTTRKNTTRSASHPPPSAPSSTDRYTPPRFRYARSASTAAGATEPSCCPGLDHSEVGDGSYPRRNSTVTTAVLPTGSYPQRLSQPPC